MSSNLNHILSTAKDVFRIEADGILNLIAKIDDSFVKAVRLILESKGRVIVCGMGKSGHIGKKIAATLASTGTRSFFIHPAEAFHGDLGMISSEDIFIGISNSGDTEEIVKMIPFLRENKNLFIALSGNRESTLAKNADVFLDVSVEREACPLELAPTASTTATLAMGDALAVALMNARGFKAEQFARFHPGGKLGRKLLTRVGEVMVKDNLPFVSLNIPFKELILTMTKSKLGMALVMEEAKFLGVITDGDLRRAWQMNDNLSDIPISNYISTSPKTIDINAKLIDAEKLFQEFKITSLVVTEKAKTVGVLQIYQV